MTRMTTEQLTRWASRYGITADDVKGLRRLINRRAIEAEHVCNGDPHSDVADRSDRNANAQAWEKDSEKTEARLSALALSLGFDGVDLGVGLYPALVKGAETCIMIPE